MTLEEYGGSVLVSYTINSVISAVEGALITNESVIVNLFEERVVL